VTAATVQRRILLNRPAILDHCYETTDVIQLSQALKRL